MRLCVCMSACVCVCVHRVYMYVCIYIIYIYIHTCICMCKHAHTHTILCMHIICIWHFPKLASLLPIPHIRDVCVCVCVCHMFLLSRIRPVHPVFISVSQSISNLMYTTSSHEFSSVVTLYTYTYIHVHIVHIITIRHCMSSL